MAIVQRWQSKTCDLSAPAISILLCSSWCLKTLLAQCALLTLQVRALFKLKFWIFPLITYFRYHVTEYCAVIGTHSTVRGDKLLCGQIPDPFPRCGIGSGHVRLGHSIDGSVLTPLALTPLVSHLRSMANSLAVLLPWRPWTGQCRSFEI